MPVSRELHAPCRASRGGRRVSTLSPAVRAIPLIWVWARPRAGRHPSDMGEVRGQAQGGSAPHHLLPSPVARRSSVTDLWLRWRGEGGAFKRAFKGK